MKKLLLPLFAVLLASCAQVQVKRTYVATTTNVPRSIYIRPFEIADASYVGENSWPGEMPIRKAIAPLEFANALRYELSKISPAVVLKPGETAPEGWLVQGQFDIVNGGSRAARGLLPHTSIGRSTLVAHVKVSDAATGQILYAFDLSGGSGITDLCGNTGASGLGISTQFDFKNAAQRVMIALSEDPMHYGMRSTP